MEPDKEYSIARNVLKRSVLVVDDHEDFAESVADILELNGYDASITFDQKSARDLLKQRNFQVALIDLRLGNTSGIDLIGSLKAIRPGILCLIMTAYAEVDTAIEAVRKGAYNYLRKPFNAAELTANLDRCYEKIRLEGQLRQAQKMEAIGTLAGGIAHDFNNILASIIGYSELAILDSGPGTKAIQHLNKVLQASHRAKDLVNQILNFTRSKEHELRPLDLKLIINDTLKLMRASLPSTIDIRRWITPQERTVLADPTQIHQVIMNICANARHAMREVGGVLEIRLEGADADPDFTVEHPDLKSEEYLMLTIHDTGHGMKQEMLERIFEPYYTTKEKGEGTGLGLAIVHGIVKSHKGWIRVSSDVGKGTSFIIYLPRASEDTKFEKAETEVDKIPNGSEKILLVDDEEDIVLIVTDILTRFGYEVVSFNKSKEAFEQFKADPASFDAVITDMTMPEMTGTVLAAHIKDIRSEIPVLLCTGHNEFQHGDTLADIGVDGILRKPIAMKELTTTLRKVLDHPPQNES